MRRIHPCLVAVMNVNGICFYPLSESSHLTQPSLDTNHLLFRRVKKTHLIFDRIGFRYPCRRHRLAHIFFLH